MTASARSRRLATSTACLASACASFRSRRWARCVARWPSARCCSAQRENIELSQADCAGICPAQSVVCFVLLTDLGRRGYGHNPQMGDKVMKRPLGLALGLLLVGFAACTQNGGPLKVDSVEPPQGTTAGGEEITIVGGGFQPGKTQAQVKFGRKIAETVTIASPTKIRRVTPSHE